MENLPFILAALACPIGMGLMMYFMMRPGAKKQAGPPDATGQEIAKLRAEVARLREQADDQTDRTAL